MNKQGLHCSQAQNQKDDRVVSVEFTQGAEGKTVRETFDTEPSHTIEQQRQGWQAILNNFASHVEALGIK